MTASDEAQVQQAVAGFRDEFARLRDEIGKMIVGQAEVVEGVLVCLFAGVLLHPTHCSKAFPDWARPC